MELIDPAVKLVKVVWSPIGNYLKHHHSLNENMNNLKRKMLKLELRKDDIKSEMGSVVSRGTKRARREVVEWMKDVEKISSEVQIIEEKVERGRYFSRARLGKRALKKIQEVEELYENCNFHNLVIDIHEAKIIPTTTLAGEAPKKKMEEIWEHLVSDDISKIGIYGMGGSGKTTIMKHIHNKLLETTDKFDNVFWVTLSNALCLESVQHEITAVLKLELSDLADESTKASELYAALEGKGRYVLMLDDLWESFPPERIGIPEPVNGCKLILTSRSLNVCHRMDSEVVKMELLSEEDAWDLFLDKVGRDILHYPSIEIIAKQVAGACACLPLAIMSVAGSMKGKVHPAEWRSTLRKLQSPTERDNDMGSHVLEILKFSYDRLKDDRLRDCLLFCALYPQNWMINREELLEYLIAEGILKGLDSRQEAFDEGHALLNELEYVCLLERAQDMYGYECVKMHSLIRDMAIQIKREGPQFLVKSGEHLSRVYADAWLENLEKISLIKSHITSIFSSHSPRCPHLSTLLLCRNNRLIQIRSSFFENLIGLKVLDLSDTAIVLLPDSVSHLVNLTALLLRRCTELVYIPSLAKLTALEKLDLSYSGIKLVPAGMELLTSLKYLDLYATGVEFPPGILSELRHLQFFRLRSFTRMTAVIVEELACLKKLETLECDFYDISDFNLYVQYLENSHVLADADIGEEGKVLSSGEDIEESSGLNSDIERQAINKYLLQVGNGIGIIDEYLQARFSREVYFNTCITKTQKSNVSSSSDGDEAILVPRNIDKLHIIECPFIRRFSLENATELKSLEIIDCKEIKCLVSLFCSSVFQSLEILELHNLENLNCLFGTEEDAAPPLTIPLPPNVTFSCLKEIVMYNCQRMETLFCPGLMQNFNNLQQLVVENCTSMSAIFGAVDEESSTNTEYNLPKLKYLKLKDLPSLWSISFEKITCNSVQKITVQGCPNLEWMPITLDNPVPSLQIICEEEWWNMVEWDGKNLLSSHCSFSER